MSPAERSVRRRDRQAATAAQVSQTRIWAEKAVASLSELEDAVEAAALPPGSDIRRAISSLHWELRNISGLLSDRHNEGIVSWRRRCRGEPE
ncbi:hypothetical protein J4G37_19205 [Microvirga sp. 3-52]|nr:hypothetical protein [Microvirga sp. 3-52]